MNVMRKHLLGLLALSALGLFGCEKATTVSVPMRAERLEHIVSLSPSTSEIMGITSINFEGRTKACNYPQLVLSKTVYGDLKPNYEAITKDRTQLVVFDSELYSDEDKVKLKSTGAKLYEFKATTINDFEKEMLTLGSLVGSETNIQQYVDRIRRSRREAEGDAPPKKMKSVLILPGTGGSHMIAGTKSFQAEIMRVIGTEPLGPDTAKFETLTPEFLFQANPDVIIVAGEAKSFLADTRFANLEAVKNLNVFGNNQDMWVRRGGRVDNLIDQAHKALMLVIKK
jgi:ABC-type Fe3+-hydroxamate transport system substrate-binding protein